MKRLLCLLLTVLTVLSLSACGETAALPTPETMPSMTFPTETVPTQILPAETEPTQPLPPETEPAAETEALESSLVDLTQLSSTMVYAEVFNMMYSPEAYIGKTVIMRGVFSKGQLYAADGSLSDGGVIFSCIVLDATACCAQGIPFDLAGDYEYPQDYPELGSEITVEGIFEIHEQDGLEFCRLADARFVQ